MAVKMDGTPCRNFTFIRRNHSVFMREGGQISDNTGLELVDERDLAAARTGHFGMTWQTNFEDLEFGLLSQSTQEELSNRKPVFA